MIGALVDKLDTLELIPIDSESLCNILHQHGINIRYLSYIAALSYIPHVREICATEMLARTIKNTMNQKMTELIQDNRVEHDQLI